MAETLTAVNKDILLYRYGRDTYCEIDCYTDMTRDTYCEIDCYTDMTETLTAK
eukprot:SAG22_NODE_22853_length_185_cov_2.244186_1_plen_52_part_10